MSFPWLTVLVALPVAAAIVVAALPAGRELLVKQVAVGFGVLTFAYSVVVALQFSTGSDAQYQLGEKYTWVRPFGLHWALGVDGIALALILLTTFITPVILLAMWHEAEDSGRSVKAYYALVLITQAMVLGAFAATDVLLFYILFEAMLIPLYFIIGMYGGRNRRYASVKFLLYNLFGGLLMLAAVIGLYVQSAKGGRTGTFLLSDLIQLDISQNTQRWLFLGFMIAFAIKAPLWPFHTWLPDTAAEAPTSQAAYLSGVVDKVGTFGMIHLCLPLFPDAVKEFAPVIVTLAVISVLYGALLAIGQTDLKRLIAYTSISHFGFIVLGIFALNSQGTAGSTLYMVNHGLSTVALFLVVGFLISRSGKRGILDFGGVQKPAPKLAGVMLVAGLSALSLPGLSTFVSEFLVLVGAFSRYRVAAVFATVGIVLAALYVLIMYQRTMTGPVRPETADFPDLRRRETLIIAPLLALIIALGFYPQPLLKVINHGTTPTLTEVGVTDPAPVVGPAVAEGTAK